MYKCVNEGSFTAVKFTHKFYSKYAFLLKTDRGIEVTGYDLLTSEEVRKVVRDFLVESKGRWLVETVMHNQLRLRNDENLSDNIQDCLQLFERMAELLEMKNEKKRAAIWQSESDGHTGEVSIFGPHAPLPIFSLPTQEKETPVVSSLSDHDNVKNLPKFFQTKYQVLITIGALLLGVVIGRLWTGFDNHEVDAMSQLQHLRQTVLMLSEDRKQLEEEAEALRNEKLVLVGQLDIQSKTLEPVMEEIQNLKKVSSENDVEVHKEIKQLEQENKRLEEQQSISKSAVEKLKQQLEKAEDQIAETQKLLDLKEQEVEGIKEELTASREMLSEKETNEKLLLQTEKNLNKETSNMQKSVAKLQHEYQQLLKLKLQKEKELLAVEQENKRLWKESLSLSTKLKDLQKKGQKLERKNETLTAKVECYISSQYWTLTTPETAWREYCNRKGILLDAEGLIVSQ
ncbi:hypothetical protein V6R21_13060 [Limibacter armeniacum]|uniref:hypothetical protein n=1 Tax=Limibacter armeniacum TaxID=466084 RepID=UPI002FE5F933